MHFAGLRAGNGGEGDAEDGSGCDNFHLGTSRSMVELSRRLSASPLRLGFRLCSGFAAARLYVAFCKRGRIRLVVNDGPNNFCAA
jgi:hypothetical protein